jgi:ribonuclease R
MSVTDHAMGETSRFFSAGLAEADPEIADAIARELGRQQHDIELIASENIVSRAVLEEASAIPETVTADAAAGREDLRGQFIVTIDPDDARDFDDAVWVERLENGHYALHVHIADVSHYVRRGSPIDREALERGTSVYFPDRAVPMLPVELSTDQCSLRPNEDRLVLSALLEIDGRGDVVSQEFTRGVIRSVERMTYTAVHGILEGDAELRARYARLVDRFELMRELATILNRKRVRRGSIDFDLPEPLLEFDEFGEMTGVKRAPRNFAHRLIEEFMLAANEAVASHIENAGLPMIFRIHERPDPKRVLEFEEVAAQFGYSLGAGATPVKKFRETSVALDNPNLTSRSYQKLVAKIEGKPEERILSYLMLRSLKQARYSDQNVGHFALAAESYTHFTSPIRRYPDLTIHRLVEALIAKRKSHNDAAIRSNKPCRRCFDSSKIRWDSTICIPAPWSPGAKWPRAGPTGWIAMSGMGWCARLAEPAN